MCYRCGSSCFSAPLFGGPFFMLLTSSSWWKHRQESGALEPVIYLDSHLSPQQTPVDPLLYMYCFFFLSSICTLKLTWSLPQRTKVILKMKLGCSVYRELGLMTCFFPRQYHYPLPHDYVGSGCAVVCWRSGHALLPIHLRVRLFVVASRTPSGSFQHLLVLNFFDASLSFLYNCLNNLVSKRKTVCNQILISPLCYGAVVSRAFSTPSLTTSPHTHRCCSSS